VVENGRKILDTIRRRIHIYYNRSLTRKDNLVRAANRKEADRLKTQLEQSGQFTVEYLENKVRVLPVKKNILRES
jgi:hypothetical protein